MDRRRRERIERTAHQLMQTFLRWAGSKRQLLNQLRGFWSGSESRYVEPFCGSACLFFDLEPEQAILSDLNSELITTYRAVRRDAGLVIECLRRLPKGKQWYYRIRSMRTTALREAEIAARFVYLNRYCFNGIYRTNSSGVFNVPFGSQKSDSPWDSERLLRCAELLSRATLVAGDFGSVLARVERGDFVYLDPPYALANRRVFSEYQASTFSVNDLTRFSDWLPELDRRGASFVVSYADSPEARRLLKPWNPIRVRTRRHIAGFVASRRHAFELLATNKRPLAGHAN